LPDRRGEITEGSSIIVEGVIQDGTKSDLIR